MTKDEMRSAWQEQWNETHEVLKMVDEELEFQVKRQEKFFEKDELNEAYALTGCITFLKELRSVLDRILYKEI